jgi:hypothetical protein
MRPWRFFVQGYLLLTQRYTFHGDQNSRRERHHLGGAPCGWIFGKELAVNLIDYAKIISRYHENSCFNYVINSAASLFQDDFYVLKALPGLLLKAITDDFSGMEIETWRSGYENKSVGYDSLGKCLAHPRSLIRIKILSLFHMLFL